MNNTIIFQTIRAGVVFGVMFFSYANTAFAAPTLTPVSVTQIRDTSANLVAQVSNQYRNSTVWFEITGGNISGGPMVVGMRSIYENGFFQWHLQDLTPGTTYHYRAVAMEGGTTVSSATGSFTTTLPKSNVLATSYQVGSGSNTNTSSTNNSSYENTALRNTNTTSSNRSSSETVVTKNTTKEVVSKKEVVAKNETLKTNGDEGFNNNRGLSASASGAGDGLYPSTLIGWIALLVAILVLTIVGHMLYEAPQKRKKEREEEEEMTARFEELTKTA